MKHYFLLFCLLVSSTHLTAAPKPKNKFLEVLGHMKMLTGFALIPLGMIAAEYSRADHKLYHRLEPSQRKDLSVFAPVDPDGLLWGGLMCGYILILWGASDVYQSQKSDDITDKEQNL